jgi:hypothetical protein
VKKIYGTPSIPKKALQLLLDTDESTAKKHVYILPYLDKVNKAF